MYLLPDYTQDTILQDTLSSEPQSKAYHWLLKDPKYTVYSEERLLQRYGMATFYYSTNGPYWKHQGGGTAEISIFGLHGIQGQNLVLRPPPPGGPSQHADRPPPSLSSPLDKVQVRNITREAWLDYETHECQWFGFRDMCPTDNETIQVLDLILNDLAGSLPEEIELLSSLKVLSLHSNQIGGSLVTQIGTLSNMTELRLDNNQLSGNVPTQIGLLTASLYSLSFPDNQLEGSIPPNVWGLTSLRFLTTGRNKLTGTIPENIGDVTPKLVQFLMRGNQLSGTLPSSFRKCRYLSLMDVSDNLLSGSLPTELGSLNKEALLGLRLAHNNLSGELPSELGLLSSLEMIELGGNQLLNGPIPSEWSTLNATLKTLGIKGTGISGTIPSALCQVNRVKFDCSESLCGCQCPCN